jgi:pyrroloquinoline quinone (PQQ) biosynthesis protein C
MVEKSAAGISKMESAKINELVVLRSWNEVPYFNGIQDEVEYWMGHGLSEGLMRESLVTGDVSESTMITIRMHPRMLARIKRLARARYLNYQSMIKQWIAERLEREDGK